MTVKRLWMLLGLMLASLALHLPPAQAETFAEAGFSETQVLTGISNGVAMEFAPDGRLFILEQDGDIEVYKEGSLQSTPFLDIEVDSANERGLLGLAFDPNFTQNHYLYVYYTTPDAPKHNRVSRFTANGDAVLPNSEVVIMDMDNLTFASNHNGGSVDFAPDGTLYIAQGDNANAAWAQDLTNRFGTIMRINPDGTIPTDNPFYNQTTGLNRAIWAYGLRNPFALEINPANGIVHINDAGQYSFEEVNVGAPGANYGWPETEGYHNNPAYVNPVYSYGHETGECVITGGAFYVPNVPNFPASYQNDYFFADYCAGWIRRLDAENDTASDFMTTTGDDVVDIEIGPDGALYYLARENGQANGGSVYRVTYDDAPLQPVTLMQPQGDAIAQETVRITWPHQTNITSYAVDVYDLYVQVVDATVDAGDCAIVCTLDVPANSVVGDYDVWIQGTGNSGTSDWAVSEFSLNLGSTTLTAPTGTVDDTGTVDLTFPAVSGAVYYVLDVYRPGQAGERFIAEQDTHCTESTCTLSVPTNGVQGEYSVWMIAGVGPYFGTWTGSSFIVGLPNVTLTAPTGSTPLTDTLTFTFNMPSSAGYVVADVYYPNGGWWREVVEAADCPENACTFERPSYGLTGDYAVWIIPGVGDSFGSWALSTFSLTNPDMGAAAVDVLGSASEPPPALDTSAVEAAGEAPGD